MLKENNVVSVMLFELFYVYILINPFTACHYSALLSWEFLQELSFVYGLSPEGMQEK